MSYNLQLLESRDLLAFEVCHSTSIMTLWFGGKGGFYDAKLLLNCESKNANKLSK